MPVGKSRIGLLLLVIQVCLLSNLVGCGKKQTNSKISFRLPVGFEGPILIASEGEEQTFKTFVVLVFDHEEIRQWRDPSSIEFVEGDQVYRELPHSALYVDNPPLTDYGVWGKRFMSIGSTGIHKDDLQKLGCGNEFFLYYLGQGSDARQFFDNDGEIVSELLRRQDKADISETNGSRRDEIK